MPLIDWVMRLAIFEPARTSVATSNLIRCAFSRVRWLSPSEDSGARAAVGTLDSQSTAATLTHFSTRAPHASSCRAATRQNSVRDGLVGQPDHWSKTLDRTSRDCIALWRPPVGRRGAWP